MRRKVEDIQPAVKLDIDPSDWQTDPMAATKVDGKKKERKISSMASLRRLTRPPYADEAM